MAECGRIPLSEQPMSKSKLILQKHARGEYEIGIQTEDGAVVARVSIWDGTAIDRRNEGEREQAAMEKATRLAHAFKTAIG
jgi:hypothetical protein